MSEKVHRVSPGCQPRAVGPALLAAALLGTILAGCRAEPPKPRGRLALSPDAVALDYPGMAVVSAEWQMVLPLTSERSSAAAAPRVFVHLLDASGALVRTFDHELPFPWRAGETKRSSIELWQSALAPPLSAGSYRLTVGLYDPLDGRRWALETGAQEVDAEEYAVAEVRVPPPDAGLGVVFKGSWWPLEQGTDRQVLARRWLRREGSLDLTGLPEVARLGLGLRIPEPGDGGARLVLDQGADRMQLRISSPCAPGATVVEGPGYHEVMLELMAAENGHCTVRIEPSFVLLNLNSFASRSAVLERLTVSPAGG